MTPSTLKGNPWQQHKKGMARMPRIIPVIAIGLVRGARIMGSGPGVSEAVRILPSAPANSGNSVTGFQSVAPSDKTLVWPLARPSAIHCLNCSAVMGPYSLPSAPMILYMASLSDLERMRNAMVELKQAQNPGWRNSNSNSNSRRNFPTSYEGIAPLVSSTASSSIPSKSARRANDKQKPNY